MVKPLLQKEGVDPASRNVFSRMPLHCAAARGYEVVVQLLLATEDNIHARAFQASTALSAATAGGQEEVPTILLEHRAKIDLIDN